MNFSWNIKLAACVGLVSVALTSMSYALAHANIVIATISYGLLAPAILFLHAFNIDSRLSVSLYRDISK